MSEDIKLIFTFNGKEEEMEFKKEELLSNIFQKFVERIRQTIEKLVFLYNGDLINPRKALKDLCQDKKKINLLVYELEIDEEENESIIKAKNVICPVCKELCLINFKDYKIFFSNCKNKHKISNILFNELEDFLKINEAKILCDKCDNKKSETNNKKFYKCMNCCINLCPLCKLNHEKKNNKNHIILDFDLKNYYCNEHQERYIYYCEKCKKDFCDTCKYHNIHKVSFLYEFIKNINNEMNNIRIKIEDLKKEKANNPINIIDQVIDNLEKYYNTSKNLIQNYNPKNSNYYLVKNIKSFIDYNKIIIQDINQILNEKNIEIKNNYISNIYKNMIIDSEFILKYNL